VLSISREILGKKEGDASLSLQYHLNDVATVAEFLWDKWLCSETKKEIEAVFPQARSFLLLSCYLHDLGKASTDFQDRLLSGSRNGIDHVTLTNFMLSDYVESFIGKSKGRKLLEDSFLREVLSYHHGILALIHLTQTLSTSEGVKEETFKNQRYIQFSQTCLYIESLLEELNLSKDILTLPRKSIPFYVRDTLSGLLIMSDWLGSTVQLFPYNDLPYEDRKKRALDQLNNLLVNTSIKKFESQETFFSEVFGFEPNALQKSVFSVDVSSKRLVFMEAPTGHGKTEAAITLAYRYCDLTDRGIYIAMPTRATSNALYNRISGFIKKVYNNPEMCKLYHSKADLFFYSKGDDECKEDMDMPSWVLDHFFKYKLTNARKFILGTTDHVLKMCMNVKHFTMHHACLVNHVIVFDEVHSYDDCMFSCLCASLALLAKYKVPVIILSATMPDEKRQQLIEAYGRDMSLCLNAYPKSESIIDDDIVVRVKEKEKNKVVSFDLSLQPEYCPPTEHEKDARAIINKIKSLGSTGYYGVVVNTVDRSQDFYDFFTEEFGKDNVILLHSRMVAEHREAIEKNLISSLGKKGFSKRKEGNYFKVVISTQIVEQSIDIDFDCLFTDLCPMDALVQRVGRLHRHSQNDSYRPRTLKQPFFYVMQAYSKVQKEDGLVSYITDFSNCTDNYANLIYSPYLMLATYAELISLNGKLDTVTETEKVIKGVFNFNADKSLFGKSLMQIHSEYALDKSATEHDTYKDMFIKSEDLKDFKKYLNKNKSFLLETGLNEVKDGEVRDTLPSLEVIMLNKQIDEYGNTTYTSCFDGSVLHTFSKEETDFHTINLPTKIVRKSGGIKALREKLKSMKPERVKLNRSPYLVFEDAELLPLQDTGITLWYDRDKGLMICG